MQEEEKNLSKRPWYKTKLGILLQIVFFPIAILGWILYLIWKSKLNLWVKIGLTAGIFLFIAISGATSSPSSITTTGSTSTQVQQKGLEITVNGIQNNTTLKDDVVEFDIKTNPVVVDELTVNNKKIDQGLLSTSYHYKNTLKEGKNELIIKAVKGGESKEVVLNVNVDLTEKREKARKAAEAEAKRKEEAWSTALKITYDELFRNNEKYVNKLVTYKGELIQVMKDGDEYTFRINVTKTGTYYISYEDTVLAIYKSNERFLEKDIVELVGTVMGTQKYKTVLGAEIELPLISILDIKVIQKAGDRER